MILSGVNDNRLHVVKLVEKERGKLSNENYSYHDLHHRSHQTPNTGKTTIEYTLLDHHIMLWILQPNLKASISSCCESPLCLCLGTNQEHKMACPATNDARRRTMIDGSSRSLIQCPTLYHTNQPSSKHNQAHHRVTACLTRALGRLITNIMVTEKGQHEVDNVGGTDRSEETVNHSHHRSHRSPNTGKTTTTGLIQSPTLYHTNQQSPFKHNRAHHPVTSYLTRDPCRLTTNIMVTERRQYKVNNVGGTDRSDEMIIVTTTVR